MNKQVTIVRYGATNNVSHFDGTVEGLKIGDECVVKTDRGTELGYVLGMCEVEEQHIKGRLLRRATLGDKQKSREITNTKEPQEYQSCTKDIERLKISMKLVSVEHLLGGEKIIFYFTSEGRVDFRELVKSLATQYKTRIEMKQIGVRDEARLLADFEHCGREICCKLFLKEFEPVTMKMAKSQKTTLDPTKISGRCGRLKCCLNFEATVYDELEKKLPKKGSTVVTSKAKGEVIDLDILQQLLTIETENHQRITVQASDVISTEEEGKGE